MNEAELRKIILDLSESQLFAVLSSIGSDGSPYCNIVGFFVSRDLRKLIFATPRDTQKFQNIESEPRVSLLIDSRSNQESDFKNASAVTITGSAKELTGDDRSELAEIYLEKNPKLSDFIHSPDCALISVSICKLCFVNQFQNVHKLEII